MDAKLYVTIYQNCIEIAISTDSPIEIDETFHKVFASDGLGTPFGSDGYRRYRFTPTENALMIAHLMEIFYPSSWMSETRCWEVLCFDKRPQSIELVHAAYHALMKEAEGIDDKEAELKLAYNVALRFFK